MTAEAYREGRGRELGGGESAMKGEKVGKMGLEVVQKSDVMKKVPCYATRNSAIASSTFASELDPRNSCLRRSRRRSDRWSV